MKPLDSKDVMILRQVGEVIGEETKALKQEIAELRAEVARLRTKVEQREPAS